MKVFKSLDRHVVLVLSSYKSGGAEKMMIQLANGISKKGYSVTLLVLRPRGPFKKLINADISVKEGLNLKSVYLFIPWIAFQFLMLNPTRIISTQPHINIVTIISSMLVIKRSRVLLREANPPTISSNTTDIKGLINNYLSKLLYPLIVKHIAISEQVKDSMVLQYKLNANNIKVIYNPVIGESFSNLAEEHITDKWVIKDNKLILSVGRISEVKDYLTLISAFNKVIHIKKCQLLILGNIADKKYFEILKQEIAKYKLKDLVKFAGFTDNPYAYMSKADLFVLSSKWEGFGNVLVEALACGCPIVSTDCPGGPREILKDGEYGELVPVGNPDLMSQAIINSLNSSIDTSKLRKRGYEFTQEKSVNKYVNYMFDYN